MAGHAPPGLSVGTLLENRRVNAALGWTILVVLTVSAIQAALAGFLLLGAFAVGLVGLAVLPALTYRRPTVMVPWEVLAIASVPIIARSVAFQLAIGGFVGRLFTYIAAAAVALVIAVELDVFTPVQMPDWVAVWFVVITTLAAAGIWAVAAWLSDLWLGTTFILDPQLSAHDQEAAVMWNFVAATVGGVVAGAVFEWYFRRRSRARARIPMTVRDLLEGT